jgi:hypothetical protein
VSRRRFLWQSSAGAAAVGLLPAATRLAPVAPAPAAAEAPQAEAAAVTLSEPLVAVVRNAAQGEIALLSGTREVVIHDLELVARLVRATG